MIDHLLPAALMAVVAAGAAYCAPATIRALPEPDPDSSIDGADKPLYTDLAARSGLSLRLAVVAGVAAAAIGWRLRLDGSLPLWCFLCVLGVVLAYIDWRTRLLPFRIVAPAYPITAVLVVLAAVISQDWHALLRAAIAWAVVYAIFTAMWAVYRRGLGYGDVRLSGILAMALGWLGWHTLLIGLYSGFVLGAIGGITLAGLKLVDRKAYPFGPFMLLGAWIGVVLTPTIASWVGWTS